MNQASSTDGLMEIRVSPAVVVVVLVLVAAILVGLYFSVIARPSTAGQDENAAAGVMPVVGSAAVTHPVTPSGPDPAAKAPTPGQDATAAPTAPRPSPVAVP